MVPGPFKLNFFGNFGNSKAFQSINKNHQQEKVKEVKTSNAQANSKNEFQVFAPYRGREENIELIISIKFIEQTMVTLSSCGTRLKTQLDFNLKQQEK